MRISRHIRDFGVFCAAIYVAGFHADACAGEYRSDHVRARIVTDVQSIKPGSPFWLGVHFEIEDDWHLNWINPGDAGLAPSIQWDLPDGFSATEIVWPFPSMYRIGPLVIYGYDDVLLLMARVTAPADLPAQGRVDIGATVDWLACAEACVPGGAELKVTLPVRPSQPRPDDKWQRDFEETLLGRPMPSADWMVQAFADDEQRFVLEVRSNNPGDDAIAGCLFYPLRSDVIEHAEPQQFSARVGGFDLTLLRAQMSAEMPDRINGVLVAVPGWDRSGKRRAISIDVPLERR
jgi:thiol:disulfide interchange protein DsbD